MRYGPPPPVSRSPVIRTMSPSVATDARAPFSTTAMLYRDWLAANCRMAGVKVCLMPNHVHRILVPSDPDGLRRALARVHRHYAGVIPARRQRTDHFWQGRFGAVASGEEHFAALH